MRPHSYYGATVKRTDSESKANQNRLGKHGGGAPDTRTKARLVAEETLGEKILVGLSFIVFMAGLLFLLHIVTKMV